MEGRGTQCGANCRTPDKRLKTATPRLLRRRVFYKTCTVGDCIRNAPLLYIYGKSGTKVPLFLIIKNSSKQTLSGIIRFFFGLAGISPPTPRKTRILPRASRFLASSHAGSKPKNNVKRFSFENLSKLECPSYITGGGSAEEFCGRKIRARGRAPALRRGLCLRGFYLST